MILLSQIKNGLLKEDGILIKIVARIYSVFGRNHCKVQRGNSVNKDGTFLRHCNIFVSGTGNKIVFDTKGKNHLVNCKIVINGNNNIVSFGKFNSLYDCEIIIDDNGGSISFGDNNKICGRTHLAAIEGTSITIGCDCLFSSNVTFRTGDSHSIISTETNKRINKSKSIVVGDRVWFGNNCTILKGVSLCDDTIVGTCSLVTKSPTSGNVVLAGIPACVVKNNVRWETERIAFD